MSVWSRVVALLRRVRVFARIGKVETAVRFMEHGLSACPGCGVLVISGHDRVVRYENLDGQVVAACRWCGPEMRSRMHQEREVRVRAGVKPEKANGRPHAAV